MDRYIRHLLNEAISNTVASQSHWFNHPTMEPYKAQQTLGKVIDNSEKFEVDMNVSQFAPEDLSVNLNGRDIVVEGHHKERSDEYGTIERHFVRKYRMPENTNLEKIESHLAKDGVLSIMAPKDVKEKGRTIPITASKK